jgi:hypothetical protein
MEGEEACHLRDAVVGVIQVLGLPRRHPAEGVPAQIGSLLAGLLENTVAALAVKPVLPSLDVTIIEWMWMKSNPGTREAS